jgi:hypothetical protein
MRFSFALTLMLTLATTLAAAEPVIPATPAADAPAVVPASGSWSTRDKALEAVTLLTFACDWGQTLDIQGWSKVHPGKHEENPIMGMHPSRATINTYFLTTSVLHVLIADQLHGAYRTAWQAVWIGAEVGTIERNYRIGIRLNF